MLLLVPFASGPISIGHSIWSLDSCSATLENDRKKTYQTESINLPGATSLASYYISSVVRREATSASPVYRMPPEANGDRFTVNEGYIVSLRTTHQKPIIAITLRVGEANTGIAASSDQQWRVRVLALLIASRQN